ncbi:MAG TPA: hypothetical protein VLM11_23580 [Streptosporangiaceae bacterium]|nr:hypothetical protein [Streptosporangiaceae bacterium]
MRRIAWTFSIASVVVLIIGLIDYLTKYNWAQGDHNAFFGNQNVLLNDGATILIAGGFLSIGSILMWILALRREHGDQQQAGSSR